MSEKVLSRLERRSREVGEVKSRVAERLIDEGLRIEEFPGIVFRDGPTGRRASLLGGPDVWEVVADLKQPRRRKGVDPFEAIARGTGLAEQQLRLAAAYYGRYPEEIDARIERNEELQRAAEEALDKVSAA